MQLFEHEWLLINQLIYQVFQAEDDRSMRHDYLHNIEVLIPYTRASFYVADFSGTHILTDAVGVNLPAERLALYPQYYHEMDYGKWIFWAQESKVYNTSEWFPENQREEQPYYQESYADLDIHFELRLPLFYNQRLMGFTGLFRPKRDPDFSEKDVFILETIKNHLALYLYRNTYLKYLSTHNKKRDCDELIRHYNLTEREGQIFQLMLKGVGNQDIAEQLSISPNTEKKHTTNIYKKLNINSRSELLKFI